MPDVTIVCPQQAPCALSRHVISDWNYSEVSSPSENFKERFSWQYVSGFPKCYFQCHCIPRVLYMTEIQQFRPQRVNGLFNTQPMQNFNDNGHVADKTNEH